MLLDFEVVAGCLECLAEHLLGLFDGRVSLEEVGEFDGGVDVGGIRCDRLPQFRGAAAGLWLGGLVGFAGRAACRLAAAADHSLAGGDGLFDGEFGDGLLGLLGEALRPADPPPAFDRLVEVALTGGELRALLVHLRIGWRGIKSGAKVERLRIDEHEVAARVGHRQQRDVVGEVALDDLDALLDDLAPLGRRGEFLQPCP